MERIRRQYDDGADHDLHKTSPMAKNHELPAGGIAEAYDWVAQQFKDWPLR